MNRRLAFPGLLALTLSACASGPPYPAQPIEGDAESISNVVVTEENLEAIVRVGRANVERVSGTNQLRVMVPIRNIADEPIQVLVQVSFLDGRQTVIGDDTNRQLHMIAAGATLPITVLSRTDVAQDWTMRIGWNR
jgi:hypothetical protein